MIDASFLSWPFFEDRHRQFAANLQEWAAREVRSLVEHHDVDASCRRLVRRLGEGGWLKAMRLKGYAPRSPGRPKALQQALFRYAEAL